MGNLQMQDLDLVIQIKEFLAKVLGQQVLLHKKLRNQSHLFVIYGKINNFWDPYSGREFGTASLEIHLKTCKKKWE